MGGFIFYVSVQKKKINLSRFFLVGTPLVYATHARFKGLLNYLKTDIAETQEATIIAVCRAAAVIPIATLGANATTPFYAGTFNGAPITPGYSGTAYGVNLYHGASDKLVGVAAATMAVAAQLPHRKFLAQKCQRTGLFVVFASAPMPLELLTWLRAAT
jgi:hypothetical protein